MWLQSSKKIEIDNEVVIIWYEPLGFSNFKAVCTDSCIPIFKTLDGIEIYGPKSFWVLSDKIKSDKDVLFFQRLIIPLQTRLFEISIEMQSEFDSKIVSTEIVKMYEDIKSKHSQLENLIQKYGFDPRDDSWVEELMCNNQLERDWFKFIRENKLIEISHNSLNEFNKSFSHLLDSRTAKNLFKKRMRYLIGSFLLRWKGISDKEKWKESATSFEEKFRLAEERMNNWFISKNGDPQLVIVKEPIQFYAGRYLFRIIERIPDLFTTFECKYIKPGIALEVFGFDKVNKYIDLDFTSDIRKKIFGNSTRITEDTYVILLKNTEVETKLESISHL